MKSTIIIRLDYINGRRIDQNLLNSDPKIEVAMKKFMQQICDNLQIYLKKNKINADIDFQLSK